MVSTNGLYDLKLWNRKSVKKPTIRARYVHLWTYVRFPRLFQQIFSVIMTDTDNCRLTAEIKLSSRL